MTQTKLLKKFEKLIFKRVYYGIPKKLKIKKIKKNKGKPF